jgi:hypothetical protein
MPESKAPGSGVDWRLTTWEGACREQLRRWAELPLERIIVAIEEMQELADQFRQTPMVETQQRASEPYPGYRSDGAERPSETPPAAPGEPPVQGTGKK